MTGELSGVPRASDYKDATISITVGITDGDLSTTAVFRIRVRSPVETIYSDMRIVNIDWWDKIIGSTLDHNVVFTNTSGKIRLLDFSDPYTVMS